MTMLQSVDKKIDLFFYTTLVIGVILFILTLLSITIPPSLMNFVFDENCLFETAGCLFLLIKIVRLVSDKNEKKSKLLNWFMIFTLVFIIGEEISWGNHFFDYKVSSEFLAMNMQSETNIHNIRIGNGLYVEALLYTGFAIFMVYLFISKKVQDYRLSIIVLLQVIFLYLGVLYRVFVHDSDLVVENLDLSEELLEYTVYYFLLKTDFYKIFNH